MEEKFVTFDFTKPDENENRRKQMEQRYYATRMNKKTTVSNLSKPTATYKGSVLDHLNEKPSTPLSAGDILKVEELARMARTTGGTEWRPPSGLMDRDKSSPADLLQARDHYIMENGGVPPPSRPPPPPVTTNYFRRASDDTFAIEHHKDSSVSTTSSHTTNDTRRSLSALPRQ
jgi:serine/threonine kinase 32